MDEATNYTCPVSAEPFHGRNGDQELPQAHCGGALRPCGCIENAEQPEADVSTATAFDHFEVMLRTSGREIPQTLRHVFTPGLYTRTSLGKGDQIAQYQGVLAAVQQQAPSTADVRSWVASATRGYKVGDFWLHHIAAAGAG